ncbi:cysteine--tRNA ligase [Anaerofustis stercorihominis]|uniref:Cysteine--tRNA ligase n=1 Tax=Anaerofustis stercorihominis TaxID=214853 RepID=A0A3E3E0A8_9FIRM|nr:cysteine--tRNA ligase [Anaerofustis stercorihominis]RGD74991.1 cysteine--tRNA ligase [Anaerofustis stercorihominis]
MKLYNTLTRKKEEFVPINEGEVNMYVCGPTVYNFFHIGNARPFIIFDTLRRYLEYKGYKVNYVQNFTDIDDKIINKAKEEHTTSKAVADKYIKEYFTDAKGLGIKEATVHPRVSECIGDIIDLISDLEKNGYAYNVDGNVYYRVSKFKDYGKLSKKPIDELISGARVEVNDEKESPLDFALWKKQKEDSEIAFDSPWGKGRPGWHIECSAMSRKYLGSTIDIHGGGEDLIFPHHENEIAQSEGANGKDFVHYFVHNGYININNEKMSKSKGNFFMVRDISKDFDLEVVRLFMLSAHYKTPVNFSFDILKQTQSGLNRLYNTKENLLYLLDKAKDKDLKEDEKEFINSLPKYREEFKNAMEDDINTANAVSTIYDLSKDINSNVNENSSKEMIKKSYEMYMELNGVLGLLTKEKEDEILEDEILELIEKRQEARKNKDFALADKIRDDLLDKGIVLEDTREGVKWHKEK